MRKKVLLILFGLFFLSFVSADIFGGYGGYGGFSGFSLSDYFRNISMQEAILFTMFVVILALISTSLKKVGLFKDERGEPDKKIIGIVSVAISLLSVYGIYNYGYIYGIEDFFSNINISPTALVLIIAVILVIFIFRFLKKRGKLRRPTSI